MGVFTPMMGTREIVMSSDNGRKLDAKERIARFILEETQARRGQPHQGDHELRKAAGRLDRLLTEIRDEPRQKQFTARERENLKDAAARLDQLLGTGGSKRTTEFTPNAREQDE